jgi:hypothetical protein
MPRRALLALSIRGDLDRGPCRNVGKCFRAERIGVSNSLGFVIGCELSWYATLGWSCATRPFGLRSTYKYDYAGRPAEPAKDAIKTVVEHQINHIPGLEGIELGGPDNDHAGGARPAAAAPQANI